MRKQGLAFSTALSNQFRALCQTSKACAASVVEDCLKLANLFGTPGLLSLLRVLLEDLDFRPGKHEHHKVKLEVLGHILAGEEGQRLSNVYCLFSQALLSITASTTEYLKTLSDCLKLPFEVQVELGLAVTQSPHHSWKEEGYWFLRDVVLALDRRTRPLTESVSHSLLLCALTSEGRLADCLETIKELTTTENTAPLSLRPLAEGLNLDLLRDFREGAAAATNSSEMASQLYMANSLAGVMEEHGYSCSSNEATFKAVIGRVGAIDEAGVAKVLGMMARTHTGLDDAGMLPALAAVLNSGVPGNGAGSPTTWNVDVVIDVLKSSFPSLNWTKVAEELDHEGFHIVDRRGFTLLVQAIKRGMGSDNFPLSAIVSKVWDNVQGQISFLMHAVAVPPEIFSFEHSQRKLAPVEGLQSGKSPIGSPNHAWVSLDLMDVLCKLADAGHMAAVSKILESPLKNCQEVLLLAMASAPSPWGIAQKEVFGVLLPVFILGHPSSLTVLHLLWSINKDEVINGMVALFEEDPTHISRILDICQELKSLTAVLDSSNYGFAAELAALASRREYLNLEKWLKDKISHDGMPFAEAVIKFLDAKLTQTQSGPNTAVGRVNLSVETLLLFLRVLRMNASEATELTRVEVKAMQIHPQLQSMHEQGEQSEVFATAIENEANSYFQKIYSEQTQLEDVIQMLKVYKSSSEQREQEVFACMVHNLFDEYRFFPKYPDKELNITAVLFGQLIHHQLVSSITLGIALRYVLDALRKPPDSKMFRFGLSAIQQFKTELPGWPQYCSHVLQIPQVRECADPVLIRFIEGALEEQGLRGGDASKTEEPSTARTPGSPMAAEPDRGEASSGGKQSNGGDASVSAQIPPTAVESQPQQQPSVQSQGAPAAESDESGGSDQPSARENGTRSNASAQTSNQPPAPTAPSLAAINAQTLEVAAQEYCTFSDPPERVRDKTAFIFNNLSPTNMEDKIQQLQELIGDEHVQWLSNYIVVKRAAQEVNFHHLYLRIVEEMGNKRLVEYIIQTTYHYVKVLLEKDRIKHEMSDRSLLKNLGSWLGQLTLAKNKPVRQKDLDLKAIMNEAYEKGKMVAVIPFVHKVLEQGKETRVYGAANPWIKGILTLLAEIYRLEGLKMNLTFEIEMIFKDFNLNIDEIPASKTLDGIQRDNSNNPDFYDTRNATPPPPQPATSKPEPPAPAEPISQPPAHEPSNVGVPQPMLGVPGPRPAGLDSSAEPVPPGPRIGMSSSFQSAVPPIVGSGTGAQQVVAADAASILSALAGTLHQLVTINPTLATLAQTVPLKRLISVGIDRAIYEIITPVVERSVMIACTTTKELVTKDFAMEPDEQKLRKAAHLMVSSLSGSLALVTCKEPLKVSLQSQLKEVLQDVLDPTLLDQTINIVIADNLDLGCTIIEKASTDKAIKEVDERLLPYYQSRQKARAAGTPFYDMSIFTKGGGRFPASLPESLRPRPGHLNANQTRVYDDFARIPRPNQNLLRLAGIAESPMSQIDQQETMISPYKPQNLADRYAHWQARLDAAMSKENPSTDFAQLDSTEINSVISELGDVVLLGQNREDVVTGIAEKLFIHMYDRPTRLAVTVLCAALTMLKNAGFSRLANHVTTWYCQISQDESRRFNHIVADGLIRANLMVFPELDLFLARCVSNHGGPLPQSIDFILYLLRQYILVEHLIRASDLASTLEVLRTLAIHSPDNDRIIRLIDQVRNVPKDADPEGLRDQVAAMFDNWAKVVHADPTDKNITSCVEQFIRRGLLKGDDITSRFFRICAELSVLHCVNTEAANQQQQKVGDGRMSYVMIDSFVKLVVTLLEVLKGGIAGLRKILEIIVLVLYRDHDDRGTLFNSRPYFRIFYGLYQELLPSDLDDLGALDILGALASALVSCRPQRVPGFTFSWLELVSHRMFLPRLLKHPDRRGWPYFRALFMGLLLFMQPYLRHAELGDTLRLLYKGVMRVMLVLLHDFPEFLCDYHVELCNVIPPSCVQMRNLILSAFPSHMRLPDPFTPNLKVDLLTDINKEPKIFPDVAQLLPVDLKNGIDQYIKSHGPTSFLDSLPQRLMLSLEAQKVEGTAYNVTIMNCVVLYTGILAIRAVRNNSGASLVQYGPAMDIFHKLANDLDTEGRYLFLNAIANQLRFPNSHTHYFSCVLLVLFLEAQQRVLQEQITRVLLERLIVHRPHPWGLLITFIELIKNKRYRFWDLGITRCAPEIGQLFDSVARSCLPTPPEGMVQDENGVAVQSAERALD